MKFDKGGGHWGGRRRKNKGKRGVGRRGGSWKGDRSREIHLFIYLLFFFFKEEKIKII